MLYSIFLNNRIIAETEGRLRTLDRGFLYGDGLFETLRTYQKKPFRLEDHITRLTHSAQYLEIPFPYTPQKIRQAIEQLLTRNRLTDAYIRMTLSRGPGVNGLVPARTEYPTFVIHIKPLILYPLSLYKTGASLVVSSIKRSTTCPLSRHKTLNFLTNYLIKKEAIESGAHDAIVLNTDNNITECTVGNIFLIEGNTVITPPLNANILPGITRKIVLELGKKHNIPVTEELFGLERILHADEVFITSSLMEIMPISKINERPVGKSMPGGITKFLLDRYKELTA